MKKEDTHEFSKYISTNGSSLCINIPPEVLTLLGLKKKSFVKVRIEVKKR